MHARRVKGASGLIVLLAGLGLSACAFERDPEVLNDPFYKGGYSAGCQTANTRVSGFSDTIHRDANLYETNQNYRSGWGDGFSACGGAGNFDDRSVFNERTDETGIRF